MSESFDAQRYKKGDHAKTHRRLKPGAERNTLEVGQDFEKLMRDGYVIIENLIPLETCATIKEEGLALLGQTGRNPFEGHQTQRVYNVLSKTRATDQLAVHPRILGLMDRLFEPSFLLSQSQIINILPGEAPQGLHHDDAFYRLPRPRQPLGAATVWAIDDFTEDNGATVIVPESHLWGSDRHAKRADAIPAVMPAGSVVFFLGTTWHGGGKNTSSHARFAVTHQYCEAYMRQQENYLLELSKETVRSMCPELQALVGYSIYPPFMGMVEGMHPLRLLES
ncbi:phytanoyl-CoA dioxygenase family protein [Marinobacter sp. S6332]|uniref:phytanoyl-CoA dioxygenase family protein n=1 Tax=Marinobacter sp. S6332 TaxID=2926403 RepID=UPI001FF3E415|nr:phytanoyl-CoA dioxygenase family protein [Marinobacter sp. S6332]MCK0163251.1 phytanoyl-CoA dioxygenase family protein [Marinobacter sp. S6332]